MNYLAINTVGKSTLIVLNKEGKTIKRKTEFSRHSETLFPQIIGVLEEANCKLEDLECLGCVIGPGSFTGIRIGLSVVKTFAYVLNLKVVEINSLELLAYNKIRSKNIGPVCAVINAGGNLLYNQFFERKDNFLVRKTSAKVDKSKHFISYINSGADSVDIVYYDNGETNTDVETVFKSEDYSTEALYLAMEQKIKEQKFSTYAEVKPIYLRVSQAENQIKDLNFCEVDVLALKVLNELENQEDDYYLEWNEIALLQSFDNPNYHCYVLENNKETIGYVSVLFLVDEIEIQRLVIKKSARLQGFATKILTELFNVAKAKGFKSVLLEVNNKNYAALSLYRKVGFIEDGCRPDYYGAGENGILMRKIL